MSDLLIYRWKQPHPLRLTEVSRNDDDGWWGYECEDDGTVMSYMLGQPIKVLIPDRQITEIRVV